MRLRIRTLSLLAALLASRPLPAQFTFSLAGREVQIHSFLSQGFAYSNTNNYLTMQTSRGSFAMTDAGVNAAIQLTDRLRIGAQVYSRNFGNLGKWHPHLDWAAADYRFRDWLAFRGGVVKTVFGLYNDTQDVDALHTFALLPQAVYPTDLRDALLQHTGGDIYGTLPLPRLGTLSYTIYAGQRNDSRYGGYPYLESAFGVRFNSFGGPQFGQDLRWSPTMKLVIGASRVATSLEGRGSWTSAFPGQPSFTIPYEEHSKRNWTNQFYGQYTAGNLRLSAEYRRDWFDQIYLNNQAELRTDVRGWYASGEYRISRRLEVGAYYSRWVISWLNTFPGTGQAPSQDSPDRHLYDKVVAARMDLTRHWSLKIEGHFMDGYGCVNVYPSGFYGQDNPQGLKPRTNLLLVRTGWSF